ncbi:MAG: hypothetical protein JOY59_11095, partial [Candidatus Eremiobacteraeota bacterium]|nr:hypothetical protein [Candidatus Eremiobacteraeota bacterium]
MGRIRAARWVAAAVTIVLVAVLVWLLHDRVVEAVAKTAVGAYGYGVSFHDLHVSWSGATADGVRVTRRGEPVAAVESIKLGYSFRDLLGGRRRFGLSYVDVERPELTLIHHRDGTYNLSLPRPSGAQKQNKTPFNIRVRVRDGSIAMIDEYTAPPQVRRQRVEGLAVDAVLSPTQHSYYRATFDLNDGHRRYPVRGAATFDDARGYESQHWTAALIPIGPLVDFALSSHSINLTAGDLRDIDLRAFSLADGKSDGAMHYYLRAGALLEGGKIYLAGLSKPVRDARGSLLVSDNAIAAPRIDAKIADVPIVMSGGIHTFEAPQLRIGIHGAGDLRLLRRVAAEAARQPLDGLLAFNLLIEGPLSKPAIFARLDSPALAFRGVPVTNVQGALALWGQYVDILGSRLSYGPFEIGA